tara:strand:- start:3063 stop:3437 length:375 start_codon:yes stop_codon:yes gene_type:complete
MKLTKKIITTKSANNLIESKFTELKKEQEKITVNMFLKQYNRLFFDIPKTGAGSHQMIIERSKTYIEDEEVALPKDKIIEELYNEIMILETELTDLKISIEAKKIAKQVKSFNDEKSDKESKSS